MNQSLDKLKTQYKSLLKISTRVHHALDRLSSMVQDDTSNEVYHDVDDPISYEEAM